jgi:4-hydroxy-3-polyprenylbenzoate decarboxylase
VNKDTELHPLVRLAFLGLPEAERKAFLFRNVVDGTGRKYEMPVLLGAVASSSDIYSLGMCCPAENIAERWLNAQMNPLKPVIVDKAAVHENVLINESFTALEGLLRLPVPISTPGFDNAPYTTASHWVTKDPESGIRNIGNYRGMVKSPSHLGCFVSARTQGLAQHWIKCRELSKPLEAAVFIGTNPSLSYAACSRLPPNVDEYEVAGALEGRPIELVKCRTVNLEIPANAEIVLEGLISTDEIEPEGPFGEFTGYMAKKSFTLYMEITAITHRNQPIFEAFLSEFPPNESSLIRKISREKITQLLLQKEHGLTEIREVFFDQMVGSVWWAVFKVEKTTGSRFSEIRKKMEAFARLWPGKFYILVDEDIDIHDSDMVRWAIASRCQPHRDCSVLKTKNPIPLDFSLAPPSTRREAFFLQDEETFDSSSMLIDARMQWPYPPLSLPSQEIMENALRKWQQLGLPRLGSLKNPWFGYNLGDWSEEEQDEASKALQSRSAEVGEGLKKRRKTI